MAGLRLSVRVEQIDRLHLAKLRVPADVNVAPMDRDRSEWSDASAAGR